MCSYSMIVGHYQGIFPNPQWFPAVQYPDYAELVRKAKLYDEMMKQKDCPDPAKEEFVSPGSLLVGTVPIIR